MLFSTPRAKCSNMGCDVLQLGDDVAVPVGLGKMKNENS